MRESRPALPADEAAEWALVGALMCDPRRIVDAATIVKPDDFQIGRLGVVFSALAELDAGGHQVDTITVAQRLQERGELAQVGGLPYLSKLDTSAPSAANATEYARIVAEKAVRRRFIQGMEPLLVQARSGEGDVSDLFAHAHGLLDTARPLESSGLKPLSHAVDQTLGMLDDARASKGISGLPTGISDLDHMLTGLHPGELLILAARPGVGKSSIALQWALSVAMDAERTAAFFSLEMPEAQLALRLLSGRTKVSLKRLRQGGLSDYDQTRINEEAAAIYNAPLYLDDSSSLTVVDLRAKARRLKQKRPDLALIVIDYLQLMSGDRAGGREQEISQISRGLKVLAKDLGLPVIALSQLNRKVEERKGGRPMLSDLRESGSLEQDADVVMFLHPEEIKEGDQKPAPGTVPMELIVAKQRNGPADSVRLLFQQESTRFVQREMHFD